jgi:archaellum component FlaC
MTINNDSPKEKVSVRKEEETALEVKLKLTGIKLDELSKDIKEFDSVLKNDIRDINLTIGKLDEASLLLNILPQNVTKEIEQLAPKLATSVINIINDQFLQVFNDNIEKCNDRLNQLNAEVHSIIDDIATLKKKKFKRIIYNLLLGSLVSILCTVVATYYILTQFPQTVRIDHKGNINVEQSKVFVDGKSNFNITKETTVIRK